MMILLINNKHKINRCETQSCNIKRSDAQIVRVTRHLVGYSWNQPVEQHAQMQIQLAEHEQ